MNFRQGIDSFLENARIAIENALNNETILTALSEWGYPREKLEVGKTLYETAASAQRQQKKEYGEQVGATDTLDRTRTTAQKTYARLTKVARAVLSDNPGALRELDLNGRRKQSLAGWLAQADQFYQQTLANPAILEALGEYGVTTAKLEAGRAQLEAIRAAKTVQEMEKGEAQRATQVRDTALEELNIWLDRYLQIARVALEDDPQLLEALGILVRS